MSKYRTAQGKTLDMAALAARNEKTRAVGNMKVNARGDTIDASGKIIQPVTQKVGAKYQNTVGNRSANVKKSPKKAPVETKTKEETELDNLFEDDIEVEKIKQNELKGKNG